MTDDPLSFAVLDVLLDQALFLEGEEREQFLQALTPDQRRRVTELLELSNALTLRDIAANASATLSQIVNRDGANTAAGRWRLQRELGSGGMGQVFYATREEPAESETGQSGYTQHAAVKVLWSHRADEEVMARFFRERRILAELDHPGLARFLDGGFLADGRPWFAMEFVDGVDVIEHALQLPLAKRLTLFLEICSTVAYAHERLIVHRDIKPQNVLVDPAGRARLLDFGVAAILQDVDDGVQTRTQGSPLTLQYASPEQITGGLITVASDVYQLGLLLFQMVTGCAAYDLKDQPIAQALTLIGERPPVAPSTINDDISADLDAIILVALNKAPHERYRSVNAFAEDLQRYLEGRPVQAVPHSRWYIAHRFIRRNLLTVSIVSISVVALAFATIISVRLADEAQDQARRSTATQQILTDVFQKADPFGDGGANVTLADALVKAEPAIAEQVAGDPLLAWEVNKTLAEIYESLGLVEHEAKAYQALLQAAQHLDTDRSMRLLVGIAGLGGTLARTNPRDAVQYFEQHLPKEPSSNSDAKAWLNAQYSYVGALARLREFDRADTETLRMATVVERYAITHARTRGRLGQLQAGVARRAGDVDAEGRQWRDAVTHMRNADNPSALAITLNNMAIHLGRTGQYDASGAAFREAIEVFEHAGHQNASLAGILRAYAGLLFRLGHKDDAIRTTSRALDMLDPSSQAYARFVANLNLAHYTFANGNTDQTLAITTIALPAAHRDFDPDSQIPERMLGVFAKLLLFAEQPSLAARSLLGNPDCTTDGELYAALEPLEDPAERVARTRIWRAIDKLGSQTQLAQSDLDHAISVYETEAPPFFDTLDHWRVAQALVRTSKLLDVPERITKRYKELAELRTQTHSLAVSEYQTQLSNLAASFQNDSTPPPPCT